MSEASKEFIFIFFSESFGLEGGYLFLFYVLQGISYELLEEGALRPVIHTIKKIELLVQFSGTAFGL